MTTSRVSHTPTGDERSDQALLQAHVDGDAEAFGVLFARHRDRLWAVALRTMGNPEDAADGLQDGMIAAFRRAGSFRGEAAVTTWLHRVVVNACLDRIRAAKIRRFESHARRRRGPRHRWSRPPCTTTSPTSRAEDAERRRRVLAALATLPAEQRAALVLVDMEGYPVAEVAEMLGCAEGTVKSRCSRGRTKLAALLADLHHPTGDLPHGNPPPDGPVQPTVRPRGPPAP